MRRFTILLSVATAFGFVAPLAQASIQLSAGGGRTTMDVDPFSQAGAFNWFVTDDANVTVDHLSQQWFWYRIGSTAEKSLDKLDSTPTITQNSPDLLNLVYDGTSTGGNGDKVSIAVTYTLTFADLGATLLADVGEAINVSPKGTGVGNNAISVFQYSDFDLNGTATDDTVTMNTFAATSGNFDVMQSDPNTTLHEASGHATGTTGHFQTAFFPTILNELNDGLATTLPNTVAVGTSLGPGDATWAVEWTGGITGGQGQGFGISKDKNLNVPAGQGGAPEPISVVVWGLLGVVAVGVRRRYVSAC